MKKLISMTDFVLEQYKKWESDINPDCQSSGRYILGTHIYANFLKTPLQIWMFVPCDENGNVLNEFDYLVDINRHTKWFKAKERCLFEGFKIQEHELGDFSIICENNILNPMWKFKTEDKWICARGMYSIEDLVKYNIQLTKTASKILE